MQNRGGKGHARRQAPCSRSSHPSHGLESIEIGAVLKSFAAKGAAFAHGRRKAAPWARFSPEQTVR